MSFWVMHAHRSATTIKPLMGEMNYTNYNGINIVIMAAVKRWNILKGK